MGDVLLLNNDMSPVRVLPWQRAMCLLFSEKVLLVVEYSDRVIHSPNRSFPWPAVVMLTGFARHRPNRVRFSRTNVLARDRFVCQYCGTLPHNRDGRPALSALTLDHVVPRAQAREGLVHLPWSGKKVTLTSWENVVTSCRECNRRKGDRTPEQAGMRLLAIPRRPGTWEAVRIAFGRARVPTEWREFLPGDVAVSY